MAGASGVETTSPRREITDPCAKCKMVIANQKFAITCNVCEKAFHSNCGKINGPDASVLVNAIQAGTVAWKCTQCEGLTHTALADIELKKQNFELQKTVAEQAKRVNDLEARYAAMNQQINASKRGGLEEAESLKAEIASLRAQNVVLQTENQSNKQKKIGEDGVTSHTVTILDEVKDILADFANTINIKLATQQATINSILTKVNNVNPLINHAVAAEEDRGRSQQRAAPLLRSRDKSTSFAQVVASKANNSQLVRNLLITQENEEDAAKTMQEMTVDQDFQRCGYYSSIERKSNKLITVKSTSPEVMTCCDQVIARKYRDRVKSTAPAKRQFLVKLTGTEPTDETMEECIDRLKRQNIILADQEIGIQRHYDIVGPKRTYRNFIIALEPATHAAVIEKGTLIFGFSSHHVYEYTDSIQCKKCWRHGHFHHGCTYPEVCRKCGGDHPLEACIEQRYTCGNCKRYNDMHQTKLNINHRVTADTCPILIDRIEGLKEYFTKN